MTQQKKSGSAPKRNKKPTVKPEKPENGILTLKFPDEDLRWKFKGLHEELNKRKTAIQKPIAQKAAEEMKTAMESDQDYQTLHKEWVATAQTIVDKLVLPDGYAVQVFRPSEGEVLASKDLDAAGKSVAERLG